MSRIFLILFIIFFNTKIFCEILMPPYVQSVLPNSVYVLVETNTPDTVTVNYGLTPGFGLIAKTEFMLLTDNSPVTYVHRIKLNNLQTNTKYYYNATQGNSTSGEASFITALISDTSYSFCWMADCRTGVSIHNQIAQLIRLQNPRFSIYGGDLCYGPQYNYWKTEFFTSEEQLTISQIPFFGIAGNHEGWTINTKAFEQNPASDSTNNGYYSFDYGNVHFTAINVMVNYSIGSPQYSFVASDLASSNKQWKIVIVHNAPYCAGGHGEDPLLITMAQNLFVPNNVDLVISGHSHFYQHNLVNNIHYLVIGTAGAPFYQPDSAYYTIKSVKDYCWGLVNVSPNVLTVRVYNNNSLKLDSLSLYKTYNGINNKGEFLDNDFILYQNYPNPFNSTTKIKFNIPVSSFIVLSIFDTSGKEVAVLVNEYLKAGIYNLTFDGSKLSSGIYLCSLKSDNYKSIKKMLLLK